MRPGAIPIISFIARQRDLRELIGALARLDTVSHTETYS